MKVTIILPHYKVGKITAYSIHQFLKYSGRHEVEIIVGDNGAGEGMEYVAPFNGKITVVNYPTDLLQSHGILIDYILSLGIVSTDYFITAETDSFPTKEGWLDYYEKLADLNFDIAGSIMELSGGCYLHPCGAMYKKSNWAECKKHCEEIPYSYFPNMSVKEGFDAHLMVHNDIVDKFLENPSDWIELSIGYKPYSKQSALAKRDHYKSICNPFHDGRGSNNESVKTFGRRTFSTDVLNVELDDKSRKLIHRIGYEPGQFFSYWHFLTNKKVFGIPTDIIWMDKRENQQQEYTIMENGFTHLWCGTSYLGFKGTEYNDVYEFKSKQVERLYNSLPENLKIK